MGAIVCEVSATLSLRASDGLRKKGWLLPLLICYPLSFILLTVSLTAGMAIGVAYGIWAASGVALTAIGARIAFKEPFNRTHDHWHHMHRHRRLVHRTRSDPLMETDAPADFARSTDQ
ncbi:DMT family transporter [Arthrobacter sp. SA17]